VQSREARGLREGVGCGRGAGQGEQERERLGGKSVGDALRLEIRSVFCARMSENNVLRDDVQSEDRD
jgi:hypothetical protein